MLTALPQGHILRHPEGEKGGSLPESYQQVQKFIPRPEQGLSSVTDTPLWDKSQKVKKRVTLTT